MDGQYHTALQSAQSSLAICPTEIVGSPPVIALSIADIQTFGMKNKNKSSKVQKHIEQVKQEQSRAGKNKEAVSALSTLLNTAFVGCLDLS